MDVSEEAEAYESSDDSSNDAEMDDSSVEISSLEKKLSENPYHYQSHVDLIGLLRNAGELNKLRHARKNMARLFPLTQTLWMEWIEDEKKFAESEKEHEHIVELFELAVKDYMCPEVWLEYSQYATRWMNLPDGLKKIRDVLERAVAAVGHHVTEGACVWDMYREFENIIFQSLQPAPGSVITPEQQDKLKKQKEKMLGLFRGQLGVPLMGMEKTYQEYLAWCEEDVDSNIKHCYKQASSKLKEIMPHEDALLAAETPRLQEYLNYIDHLTKSGTSSHALRCAVYERALVDNCLDSALWQQYLTYMSQQSTPIGVMVEINLRSVRNCPWIGQLWIQYLEALERSSVPKEKLDEAFDEALKAGFSTAYEYSQLWLARCAQIRRLLASGVYRKDDLTESFEAATKCLTEKIVPSFKQSGDPEYSLWTFWSHCEASISANLKLAESILKNLTQSNPEARRKLSVWKEYYDIMWLHGDENKVHKCRGILRQAVQHCAIMSDAVRGGVADAEIACEMLMSFERRHGTMIDMDESTKKINLKLSRISKHREKEAATHVADGGQKKTKPKSQPNKKQVQKKRKATDDTQDKSFTDRSPKRQKLPDVPESSNDGFKAPAGIPIRYVPKSARKSADAGDAPVQTDAGANPTQSVSKRGPPPGYKPKSQTQAEDENNNSRPDAAQGEGSAMIERSQDDADSEAAIADRHSIFISNLDYKLDNVEGKLKEVFCSCGNIVDVRLVKNNKGQFRGFCYIQFSDENAAAKALQLDRTNLDGRPMFVSPNVDKKKQPNFKVFKYDLGLEKHKLFVSNLSFHTTEATLTSRFSQHGPVKGVRIVTNRKGQSKGLAYVEYEKESDAAQAVLKMDGSTIDEFAIKVAISNPPSRKTGQDKARTHPARSDQFKGSRGRGRTQLSMMVPRSVNRPEQSASRKVDAAKIQTHSGGMSNRDFANLLMKR